MLSQPQAHAPAHARPNAAPTMSYSGIPRRLLTDLHDTPLAIGLYALVARMFLIVRAPVPLSRADVLRFDTSLKAGAIKRAFDRLVAGGWLIVASQTNRQKRAFTPTWGPINGVPTAWQLADACHGRPRHIQRLMLDRNLLDICMGKLTPHATLPATITRYITAPALTLSDIGCYALTLADIPRPTAALRWLGLIHADQARPLPAEQRLLALISQQTLAIDAERVTPRDTELTLNGTRRLGLAPLTPPNAHDSAALPLFFVPPSLIGCLIPAQIGDLIGSAAVAEPSSSALAAAEPRSAAHTKAITWESQDDQDTKNHHMPATCTRVSGGGEAQQNIEKKPRAAPSSHKPAPAIPDTAATQLLKTVNVKPEQQIEFAELSTNLIEAAIKDGRSRDGIRDLAGWVVHLLRANRDHGWNIQPPQPRADAPAALSAAFARYATQQEAERGADANQEQRTEDKEQRGENREPENREPENRRTENREPENREPENRERAPRRVNREPENQRTREPENRVPSGRTGTPQGHPRTENRLDMSQPDVLPELWEAVQAALRARIPRAEFNAWLGRMSLRSIVGGVATLVAPSAQVKQAVEDRYLAMLRELLALHADAPLELRLILGPIANRQTPRGHPNLQSPISNLQSPIANRQSPDWICPARWDALPVPLRAALIGSTLVDAQVQYASVGQARSVERCYAAVVAALLAGGDG